jgi:AraC family transcriptional regulator
LITPDELPVWVPGELMVDSAPLGWEGVRIRGYRYAPLEVPIPGMRDYMVVVYKHGTTLMNRRCTGDWRNEQVAQGCVSLLTHAAQSNWRWGKDIEVNISIYRPRRWRRSLRTPMIVISKRSSCATS